MTRSSSLIPGFRFHPTDVELVMYYLKRKVLGKRIIINAVAEVNIYDFSPWDLPDKSSLRSGDLEWYFFCPKARKYSSGSRANRATEIGFWKATGKERPVKYKERTVAMIKTLVFHHGTAPKGKRTDWVMYEYGMKDELLANAGIVQDSYVLCKIFQKAGVGPKNGAQYGAPFNEEEWNDDDSESQLVIGLDGTTNALNHKQNGPATTTVTEPGSSSMVTFSANETTNVLNHKQKKGPATMNTTEPGSSTVTFSANHKPKGPATTNTIQPMVTFSANATTNALDRKQKGPAATTNATGPGSSTVTFSENGTTTNAWDHKKRGPVTTVPWSTCGLMEPGPSTVTFSGNERCPDAPANDDVLFFEDIALIMGPSSTANDDDDGLFSEDLIMGVSTEDVNGNNKKEGVDKGKSAAANEDNGIYDNLDDLFNLDDLECKKDGAEFTLAADDYLRGFYVD